MPTFIHSFIHPSIQPYHPPRIHPTIIDSTVIVVVCVSTFSFVSSPYSYLRPNGQCLSAPHHQPSTRIDRSADEEATFDIIPGRLPRFGFLFAIHLAPSTSLRIAQTLRLCGYLTGAVSNKLNGGATVVVT
ncbi:hypothetical protein CSHISOI_01723 [Colletotrichum shisoi]|uniref:Uncharacterized protein n=1 Tax=Colletotrichum shisoi TaxID=2078593 RepID=A0A5Q4C4Y9_9PEZI|nr:hypothetical protein CSHISOI_01723 [Colletotrichum shisoi]